MFQRYSVKYVYIVDETGRLRGVVASRDITAALVERPDVALAPVRKFLRTEFLYPLLPTMSLDEALQRFLAHQGGRLPIVQGVESPVPLGVICKSALPDAYSCLHQASLYAVTE